MHKLIQVGLGSSDSSIRSKSMKQITILVILLLAMNGCASKCKFEGKETHEVAKLIVEALAAYAEKHGRPQSIADVKAIPYALKSCTDQVSVKECDVFVDYRNAYYFQIQDRNYAVIVYGWGGPVSKNDFGFKILHNDTRCSYPIYKKGQIIKDYSKGGCSLLGRCKAWGKQ